MRNLANFDVKQTLKFGDYNYSWKDGGTYYSGRITDTIYSVSWSSNGDYYKYEEHSFQPYPGDRTFYYKNGVRIYEWEMNQELKEYFYKSLNEVYTYCADITKQRTAAEFNNLNQEKESWLAKLGKWLN